jgi:hypothetical protein
VEQHGSTEKPLEQSVVQFVHDPRTLSATLFQADITFEERLALPGHPKRLSNRGFRLRVAACHEYVLSVIYEFESRHRPTPRARHTFSRQCEQPDLLFFICRCRAT